MDIQSKGFTLPEVASVAAMVSIVAALGYPMLTNLISRTEYAAAKLALSSLHRKCEAINMLGVAGTGEMVDVRGYKIKTSKKNAKEIAEVCKSKAIVFISKKDNRPSLYYNIATGGSGCLVSSRHLNGYPECAAKEQTTLAEAINRAGSLMKSGGEDYYSFESQGSSTSNGNGEEGGGGKKCDKNIDPDCKK